jgi:hypothetical protein
LISRKRKNGNIEFKSLGFWRKKMDFQGAQRVVDKDLSR